VLQAFCSASRCLGCRGSLSSSNGGGELDGTSFTQVCHIFALLLPARRRFLWRSCCDTSFGLLVSCRRCFVVPQFDRGDTAPDGGGMPYNPESLIHIQTGFSFGTDLQYTDNIIRGGINCKASSSKRSVTRMLRRSSRRTDAALS